MTRQMEQISNSTEPCNLRQLPEETKRIMKNVERVAEQTGEDLEDVWPIFNGVNDYQRRVILEILS